MDLNLFLLCLLSALFILVKKAITAVELEKILKKKTHLVKNIKILSTEDLVSKNPTGLVISMFSSYT